MPESRLHFLDYWRIIRIRKAVIILVFLLVSVTATFFTFLLTKYYSSNARIEVHLNSTDIPVMNEPSMTGMYDPYFIQTEFEVIRSQTILDRVIERLHLNDRWTESQHRPTKLRTQDTRELLKGMLNLDPVRNTSLIDITVYDTDANEAALLAQTVAEEYEKYRQEDWEATQSRGIEALTNQTEKLNQQIADIETNLTRLRAEEKPDDSDPNSMNPGTTLNPQIQMQINNQILELKANVAEMEATLTNLEVLSLEDQREAIPTITSDAELLTLLQNLSAAKSERAKLAATLKPDHPDLMTAEKLIEDTDKQIDSRVKGILEALHVKLESAKAQIKERGDDLAEAKAKDQEILERTAPYYREKDHLAQLKEFQKVLNFQAGQESVKREMPTVSMVTIINKAEPVNKPVRPKKWLNITLGLIVGLLAGLGLAFFIEYLDTSVKTIDDVERTLQAPVLGVIPQNVGYLLDEGAESPHAEAYRVLRTNLLFSRKDDKLNTIAVVSAGAGEGKSTTVCNLATVFAQSGARVLMVDSDLRRPTLHRLLQVANTLGLTNYLLKQNTLEEVIQTTKLASLDFMASGKLPSSSLGILSSAQMRDLINNLKGRYDYVFFDSPPIMGVSDASVLASEVDMTLQVIQYRRYPQPMNIRAKQLIEKVGGNLIGIVLNNINMAQDESYYYYSGYYHDYYGKNDDDTGAAGNGATTGKSRIDVNPPKS